MSAFRVSLILVLLGSLAGLIACSKEDNSLQVVDDIAARRAQFVQLQLGANLSHLSDGDRAALDHLAKAANLMDAIFDRQVWAGNAAMMERVEAYDGPNAAAFKDYYRINKGPWDRLTDMQPFVNDIPHPDGAGFYPEDMTVAEFEQWLVDHPEDEEAFKSLYTMIVRDSDGGLEAIPYSEFFHVELEEAAQELLMAADSTTDPTLAVFLRSRAEALLDDDYFQSDMDWMDLAGDLEVVIGPYETYEDLLFGYKASFESFLCVVNPQDSEALGIYKDLLPFMEGNLPIDEIHKNPDRGSESPIRVADEVYTAGDTRAGVQTLAFNLPNDERVREAKGSKKVMLKNMIRAKYDAVLTPISQVALPPDERDHLNFDSYFDYILFHELSHGLGPGQITVAGRDTEVRMELKDLYSAFEEAKADIVGMYNLYALFDQGVIDGEVINDLPWTATAGLFRSVRFGVGSAHGQGVAMEMNFLLEQGAVEITDEGYFRPVPDYFRAGVRNLAHELLMIQALGDYEAAQAFHAKYMKMTPEIQAVIDQMDAIPVDVDPVYAVGGEGHSH
jgi:hypothetical protein